jgi:hypothetical protein
MVGLNRPGMVQGSTPAGGTAPAAAPDDFYTALNDVTAQFQDAGAVQSTLDRFQGRSQLQALLRTVYFMQWDQKKGDAGTLKSNLSQFSTQIQTALKRGAIGTKDASALRQVAKGLAGGASSLPASPPADRFEASSATATAAPNRAKLQGAITALDAATKVLGGDGPTVKTAHDALAALKSSLALANTSNKAQAVAATSQAAKSYMDLTASLLRLGTHGLKGGELDFAMNAVGQVGEAGKALGLPANVVGAADGLSKAIRGKGLDGKPVSPEDRVKALLAAPAQIKGLAEGAQILTRIAPTLSGSFATVAEQIGAVNPLFIGAQVTLHELEFLNSTVYAPAHQALSGTLLKSYFGGEPDTLIQSLSAQPITEGNASQVTGQLLLNTFNHGGSASGSGDAQKTWSIFLRAHLSDTDVLNLKSLAANPDAALGPMRQSYAEKLRGLAIQFIRQEVKAAS